MSKTELLYNNLRFWLLYLDKKLPIDGDTMRAALRDDVLALLGVLGDMRVNETLDELDKLVEASRDKNTKPPVEVIGDAFMKARRAAEDEIIRQEEARVLKNAAAIKRRLEEIMPKGATGAIGATGATGPLEVTANPNNDPKGYGYVKSGECQDGPPKKQDDDTIMARHRIGFGWEHYINGEWVHVEYGPSGVAPSKPEGGTPVTCAVCGFLYDPARDHWCSGERGKTPRYGAQSAVRRDAWGDPIEHKERSDPNRVLPSEQFKSDGPVKKQNTNPNSVWVCPVLMRNCVDECVGVENCKRRRNA